MKCTRPAKLELYEVVRTELGQHLVTLGVYCIEHFHSERDRLKAEGRRTGVSILVDVDPTPACRAEIEPSPSDTNGKDP